MNEAQEKEYYALYTYNDSETYAIGPFVVKKDAQFWLSGFKKGVEGLEDIHIIGVVENIDASDEITIMPFVSYKER